LRRISALKQDGERAEISQRAQPWTAKRAKQQGMSLFRSVSRLMTNRKIENASLLFTPLNELAAKHDFQRFWTAMKLTSYHLLITDYRSLTTGH